MKVYLKEEIETMPPPVIKLENIAKRRFYGVECLPIWAYHMKSKLLNNFKFHSFNEKPTIVTSQMQFWFKDGVKVREEEIK